jgi:Fe2+ transport system protein B
MEGPTISLSPPAVITLDAPKPDFSSSGVGGVAGKARAMLDTVTQSMNSWKQKILGALPKNFTVWLIAITCLIVLVAVSRILTLQKSVTELQSRPVVDENMIRVAVRKHLEETVKAMEQHNKAQAMAKQAEEAARMAEMQRQAMEQHQRMAAEQQQREAAEAESKRLAQVAEESKRQAAEAEKLAQPKVEEARELARGNSETLDEDDEPPPPLEKKKTTKVKV